MSEDNLRRLLGTLDEAADPTPAFRESLYASLAGGLRFGGVTTQPARRFWSGRRSMRLMLVLVAIGLALVLAFGFAVLALKPAPQSACVTGDFAAVRAAVAAAPAYDYRTTGTIHTQRYTSSNPQNPRATGTTWQYTSGDPQDPLATGTSGQYRAPDRLAFTFDDTGQAPGEWPLADGLPVRAVRWIGTQGYEVYAPMGQPEPSLWRQLPDPLLQEAALPDFVSRPPTDPISTQIAWSRATDSSAVPGASCAFVATIKPSTLSTQTIHVWIGATDLPVQIHEVRDGFRLTDGESRDQDLVTTVTYPADPAPVEPPSTDQMQPLRSHGPLPTGFTFPPIFPPAEHVIHVGETAILPDREVTAVEVRERTATDDGHAAPPGFVFVQLHIRGRRLL